MYPNRRNILLRTLTTTERGGTLLFRSYTVRRWVLLLEVVYSLIAREIEPEWSEV